jgi:EAL domain-containing protein (putative c-di-GMP-specific phosphodiesterase class I)
MSLVRDVHLSKTKTKVVRSMISLAKDMGMMVVGEGVESQLEASALLELGCDFLQGFYYGKPAAPFVGVKF